MGPKTSKNRFKNGPRAGPHLEPTPGPPGTLPGAAWEPQNLTKQMKNPSGGTCGARRTESATFCCRVRFPETLPNKSKSFWSISLTLSFVSSFLLRIITYYVPQRFKPEHSLFGMMFLCVPASGHDFSSEAEPVWS